MNRRAAHAPLALLLGLLGLICAAPPVVAAQPCPDAGWAVHLPAGWKLGEVSGLAVDAGDHLWIVHRSPAASPAPPVIELDRDGQVIRAWSGSGPGHDWPEEPHSITVDAQQRVWISGNGPRDGQVLVFDAQGHFLRQIGHPGNAPLRPDAGDTTRLGRPTGIAVDEAAHEVFIADGYANRRVIVFDSETGAFRRQWGAFGGAPVDRPATPARQFGLPVHCVRLGPGELVSVCDRRNDRVQQFHRDGSYVGQWRIAPGTGGMGSAWDLAFIGQGRLAAVADGGNEVVHVLRGDSGQLLADLDPRRCGLPGFRWVHSLAADSQGHLYAGEVTGKRILRFTVAP